MATNTARIAKNTLMLYFRQILIMLVSLYTVRVVLETLGAEDYGIYNVVAGVVLICNFLSDSMASACQRYYAIAIGRDDTLELKNLYSLNIIIFLVVCLIIIFLLESFGLWFVCEKLVYPVEREKAVQVIYQCSIATFVFAVMAIPYRSLIIAYEDITIYAYISVFEGLLKLGAALLIKIVKFDRLISYGILLGIITGIVSLSYMVVCKIKYRECIFKRHLDITMLKEMTEYIGYNLVSTVSWACRTQVITIMLNQFFNPVIIAARTIATQVNNAAASFSRNFNVALNPQIVKSYAAGEKDRMFGLLFFGVKASYFLMFIVVLPLMIEVPSVLAVWLNTPPEYTSLFLRLVLLESVVNAVNIPLVAAIVAAGKIKFEAICGCIGLFNIPLSWVLLLTNHSVISVYIVSFCLTVLIFVLHILILKRTISLPIGQFFAKLIVPLLGISLFSAIIPYVLSMVIARSLARLFLTVIISIAMCCLCMFVFGLTAKERGRVQSIIAVKLDSFIKPR
jgi:O-antigen/teichoic acid export membrane protein